MNFQHVVFFCFSSAALFDGHIRLVGAQLQVYTKMEAEDFNLSLDLPVPPGSRKYLCRNPCRKGDVLIEMQGFRTKSGRYIIRYDSNDNNAYLTITELTSDDTGRYKFGVSTSPSSLGSFQEFEIKVRPLCDGVVTNEESGVYSVAEGGNVTITCSLLSQPLNRRFLCRGKCNKLVFATNDLSAMSDKYTFKYVGTARFNVTITQVTPSDSGRYRCGVGRQGAPSLCQAFEISVTSGNTLRVVVGLIVGVMLLAVCALFFYKWKTRNVDYTNSRGNGGDKEVDTYDDCAAVSTHEGPIYQDLDEHSRDHEAYWSFRHN